MTTPNGRMADGMLGRDGMVPRWRQLRPSAAHQPAGSRDGEAVGMLADRRDELGRARTQTVDRLHRLLLERLPGGAKKYLSARQARALVATVKPRDVSVRPDVGSPSTSSVNSRRSTRTSNPRGPGPQTAGARLRFHADGAARHRPRRRRSAAGRRRRHPPLRRPGPVRLLERHRTAGRLLRAAASPQAMSISARGSAARRPRSSMVSSCPATSGPTPYRPAAATVGSPTPSGGQPGGLAFAFRPNTCHPHARGYKPSKSDL
jgi:hypothetical protein